MDFSIVVEPLSNGYVVSVNDCYHGIGEANLSKRTFAGTIEDAGKLIMDACMAEMARRTNG